MIVFVSSLAVVSLNRFFTKAKGGYALKVPEEWARTDEEKALVLCEGRVTDDVMANFRANPEAQQILWDLFVRELCKQ